jgi:hypothetical protein
MTALINDDMWSASCTPSKILHCHHVIYDDDKFHHLVQDIILIVASWWSTCRSWQDLLSSRTYMLMTRRSGALPHLISDVSLVLLWVDGGVGLSTAMTLEKTLTTCWWERWTSRMMEVHHHASKKRVILWERVTWRCSEDTTTCKDFSSSCSQGSFVQFWLIVVRITHSCRDYLAWHNLLTRWSYRMIE